MSTEEPQRQKGVIILSVGRSGTNWLKTIGDATGEMGISSEWLGFEFLKKPWQQYSAQSYYDHVMQSASTPNGRFSLKIFPRHLRHTQACFGFDFIRKCVQEHDVKFYLLTRDDRLGQAISRLKAKQSRSWSDTGGDVSDAQKRRIRYNFRLLCRHYFDIGNSYDFWRSYLAINPYSFEAFSYEALLPNPAPFFESTAKHLGVPPPESFASPLKIQRDALTENWRQRFEDDIKTQGIHPDTYNLPQPDATIANALKILSHKPIKPSHGGN